MVAIKKANKATPRRARGEGSIKQQKSGMWVGQIDLPDDPRFPGVRQRAKVRSMDYDACMVKFEKAKAEKAKTGSVVTSGDTVGDWLDHYLNRVDKSRPSTRQGYRSAITNYIKPSIGHIKLRMLDADDIESLESYIVETKKLSSTTALQAHRLLSRALKYAERRGKVFRNVATLVDPPRRAAPNLKALSTEEGIAIIRSVTEERLGSRWATALLTGARQGEVLGLEIERVDFEYNEIDMSWQLQRVNWRHGDGCALVTAGADGIMSVYECGRKRGTDCPTRKLDAPADWEHRYITGGLYWSRPKSKAGWRIIPLVEPLRSILARRIAESQNEPNPYGLVWTADQKKSKGGLHTNRLTLPLDGSPVDPARDNKAWHAVLANATMLDEYGNVRLGPLGKPVTVTDVRLHDARHAAVTILYDLGIPETLIQDIVGQSTVATTRNYRHKSKAQRALLAEALGALGRELSAKLTPLALPPGQEPPLTLEAA